MFSYTIYFELTSRDPLTSSIVQISENYHGETYGKIYIHIVERYEN